MNFLYHLSFVVIIFYILYALYIKLSENVTISWCIAKIFLTDRKFDVWNLRLFLHPLRPCEINVFLI